MKFDMISFGSAVLDVFIKSPDLKLVKSGQLLAAPYGAKCEVESLTIGSGGGGTNTAVGFARLGLKAAVVARCGWDLAGKIVRQEIKKEGVNDSLLVQIEGEKTDYSTILLGPDGGRTIFVYRGSTRLEKSVIDFKKLNAFWFYLSSLEGNLDLLTDLVNYAQKNHTRVAVNPGRRELKQKKKLLVLAQNFEVLLLNQDEAAQLFGLLAHDEKVFKKIESSFSRTKVVVTNGVRGVRLWVPQKGWLMVEGLKVKSADATGAGDGFGSGFVGGLAKGWDLEKALKIGVANGAAAVTKIGAKAGLLKEREIDFWLKKKIKYSWRK